MTTSTTTKPATVAHICLTTDHDMDTLLAQESSRIIKCAKSMDPVGLEMISAWCPTPTVATPRWLSSSSRGTTSTTTGTLAPVSLWGKPNVIACHSPEDTTDYLSKVLTPIQTHSSSTAPPYGQISQYDHHNHNNNASKATWLSTALVTTGTPLLSVQDANRLYQGLGTIQNVVLATPAQFQNTCLLNQQTSNAIHDFFNTDQPI